MKYQPNLIFSGILIFIGGAVTLWGYMDNRSKYQISETADSDEPPDESSVTCPKCLGAGDYIFHRGNHASLFIAKKCTFCIGRKTVSASRAAEYIP